MKLIFVIVSSLISLPAPSQALQLQYDMRHTFNKMQNPRNYLTLYFEYFKNQDSGKRFIKPGSFLLKTQADFAGQHGNINNYYMQVSQTVRMWKPKIFLNLQYSGGLGVTEPREYSYYLTNTYSLGIAFPFRWGSAWLSSVLNYKYVSYKKPSNDFLYTFYWWKELWNYKVELSGDFSIWTENRNHGDDVTNDLNGKAFFFFAEPQISYNLARSFSAGAKIYCYYHVLVPQNQLEIYPVIAFKWKLYK